MTQLYRGVCVYRRREDHVVVYRCLVRLGDGIAFVQSADRVRSPVRREEVERQEQQFWELLIEAAPEERSKGYRTLDEAITAFEADFS